MHVITTIKIIHPNKFKRPTQQQQQQQQRYICILRDLRRVSFCKRKFTDEAATCCRV